MAGLTVQNFVSAATGLAVLVALCRGISRRSAHTLGNFWVDMTRATLYGLLPLCLVLALLLVWQVLRPDSPGRHALARPCAAGVLLAALLGSAVGLLQYFGQTDGWWGWLHPAQPGVAMGQLTVMTLAVHPG